MDKTIQIECPSCKGTGLYKGYAEKDDCAVICANCAGKGFINYSYNEFHGLKKREGIKRIFASSCGYIHSAYDVISKDGNTINFEKYGCTYEEWLNGAEPKPVEDLYCPYIYFNQGIGNEPLLDCQENHICGTTISSCKKYLQKADCWAKFWKKENINPYFDLKQAKLEE